jgi:hypothetical protein
LVVAANGWQLSQTSASRLQVGLGFSRALDFLLRPDLFQLQPLELAGQPLQAQPGR